MLERLPTIVAQALEDLETLLGTQQVDLRPAGRTVAAIRSAVVPDYRWWEASAGGRAGGQFIGNVSLVSGQDQKAPLRWLGEGALPSELPITAYFRTASSNTASASSQ